MQVLSAAVKPHALWVAAHHLELSTRADGLWSGLLEAVADLLAGNDAELDVRRYMTEGYEDRFLLYELSGHVACLVQKLSQTPVITAAHGCAS